MNISSLLPPVNTAKLKSTKRSDIAVAGSETNKDAPMPVKEHNRDKRRGQDRRQRKLKPLVDFRSGQDRRESAKKHSISLKI